MIFVSSPYTHEFKEISEKRFEQVTKFCAQLVSKDIFVFSPIVYGHTLASHHDMPTDWQFWKMFCEHYLKRSDKMIVLKMNGWDESTGVKQEIEFAKLNNIPIQYMEVETNYLEKVILLLEEWNQDEKYYDIQDIINNIDHINQCEKDELSPYKCLTFLYDYMNEKKNN